MNRTCRRSGCNAPATALLTLDYDAAAVWIDDLAGPSDPNRWELCTEHAARLTVPRGWVREDRRVRPTPLFSTAVAV